MIPHNKLNISNTEKIASQKVINSGWIAQGKEVLKFENEICKFLNLPNGHAVAVSSCSMAMFVTLTVLKAKNKTVGIPVYVSRVLRGAISTAGAKEKLFDIETEGPNIDMNEVKKNPPKFLIVPHMFGIPVDLSQYKESIVIENCAHSLGGFVNGVPVGLQRDVGVLSFQATKLITSGGMGGMIISKNKRFINKAREYRDFDTSKVHVPNLNVKMTDIHAAIGIQQLKKLKKSINKRAEIFNIYNKSGLDLIGKKLANNLSPVRYRAIVRTKNPKKIIKYLNEKKVKSIIPIEKWELLSKKKKFKNSLKMTKSTISLPIYPLLSYKNAKKIAKLVTKLK